MSESERKREREKARKSKLASLKNKDKKSKMIGKRENEETVRKPRSMDTDAQEERLRTKLLTINERKNIKTPDYCIIYIFAERRDTRILSIKTKERNKKAGKPINGEK